MKYAAYLILGVVAVFVVCAIVSAIIMAVQMLIAVLAVILLVWAITKVATFFTNKAEKPP